MQTNLVSIIVPVFNSETYLPQCLDSIVTQTYKKLEIILVDDGSTDNSGLICDEYAKQDSRIYVIHQKNNGQIAARFAGISAAKGDFIGFVDSDDWIEQDKYEYLIKRIGSADLITSGIFRHNGDGKISEYWKDNLPEGLYESPSKLAVFFDNLIVAKNYDSGPCYGGIMNDNVSKLFRTELLKQIIPLFSKPFIRYEEDLLVNIIYALKCRAIRITHRYLYHYRKNPDSVCHKHYPHYLSDQDIFYETVVNSIKGHMYEKSLIDQWQRRFLSETIQGLGTRLQLSSSAVFPMYFPPFNSKLCDKKVALFGSGKVGKSYQKWFQFLKYCEITLWVDNKPSDNVFSPDTLCGSSFDILLIAIKNEFSAKTIKQQALELGVPEEKILWYPPINVLGKMCLEDEGT